MSIQKNIRNESRYVINSLGGGDTTTYLSTTLTFSGAIGATAMALPVTFEKTGNYVVVHVPHVYESDQVAGTIISTTFPSTFRPSVDRLITVKIINGSAGGATSTNAVTDGAMYVRASGILQIGIGCLNDETLNSFGSGAISGSGNGLLSGTYVYTI